MGGSFVRPDRSTSVQTPGGLRIPFRIVELKNEIGEGKSDPIVQGERSYASIFCSAEVGPFLPHIDLLIRDYP